jgi:hypothetical protein
LQASALPLEPFLLRQSIQSELPPVEEWSSSMH